MLEVVGTSIQPAFVIQEHGVNSPDLAHAQGRPTDEPQGILSKLPSKKEVATAKKLAVKKTQTMKKTVTKKVPDAMLALLHIQTLALIVCTIRRLMRLLDVAGICRHTQCFSAGGRCCSSCL